MKITAITPYLIDVGFSDDPALPWLLVRVETDEGIDGVGECTDYYANRMLFHGIGAICDELIGRDATGIEAIWQLISHRLDNVGVGYSSHLAAAIDIALWDIAGKRHGVPIHQLLGGALRPTLALYGHVPDRGSGATLDAAIAAGRAAAATGIAALKTDPFPWDWDASAVHLDRAQVRESVAWMTALRDALGPDYELMVDAHGRLDVPSAIAAGRALEPVGLTWYEEPCHPEGVDALRQVRRETHLPLCVGERHFSRRDYLTILAEGLVDHVMPDVAWCGGISEARRIASIAEGYFIPLSPHDTLGPVAFAASAQVARSIPNFYRLEFAGSIFAAYDAVADTGLRVESGQLHMADRPGLGVTIDWDAVKRLAIGPADRRASIPWPRPGDRA